MNMLNRLKSTAILLKNHRLKFAALLTAFSLISFALPLAAPFMIQYVIGRIESGMDVTPRTIFLLILSALLMLTLDYLINVYGNVMCANLIYRGSADLYKDLPALPYGEREAKYKEEELLQNITAFTDSALSLWVMIIRLVISVIVIGVLLILSMNVHYTVCFFILAHIGITVYAGKKLQDLSEAYASELQDLEAGKNKEAEELIYMADFINMNGLQSVIKSRLDQTRWDIFRVQNEQLKKNNLYLSLQKVMSELVSGFIYPVLGYLPGRTELSGGNLASVKSIIEESGTQTQNIQEMAAYIPYHTVPIDNGRELFSLKRERKPSLEEKPSLERKPSHTCDGGCALVVDRLCFEADGRKILQDINFRLKEGEHIAVMGENGSGKSTLLRCIMGMYVPTSGSITLFGKSPADDMEYFRENYIFSYMPAASQLYEASIDDNILMGSFREINLEHIKNTAGVSDFTKREISSISQLSGGEQQRVNAARAFSNSSAKLILLDEPTASLDRERAEKLMHYLRSSKAAVIYTTHREEEAAFADRVIRMCGGKDLVIHAGMIM